MKVVYCMNGYDLEGFSMLCEKRSIIVREQPEHIKGNYNSLD